MGDFGLVGRRFALRGALVRGSCARERVALPSRAHDRRSQTPTDGEPHATANDLLGVSPRVSFA